MGIMPVMERIKKLAIALSPHMIALFGAAVFLDSLRYKFTDHPNTQVIFGTLDAWAATWGAAGLFSHTGLFSQYVIGTAELVASALLLIGIMTRFRTLQVVGALVAFCVMTGAVFFHLFTPLGIDPNNDGGGLFIAACVLWAGSGFLVYLRRSDLIFLLKRFSV
jgi:uncharacterized membrane protein YkgB